MNLPAKAIMRYVCFLYFLTTYFAFGNAEDRLDLINVTNQTFNLLNITLSIFSLQDALFPNSYEAILWDYTNSDIPYVFADACKQPDGTRNCTTSCNDPAFVFENLETLHNCMVFPEIAAHYYADNLTKPATTLAQDLGIEPIKNASLEVTGLIQKCLTNYCESIPGCKAASENHNYNNQYITPYRNSSNWSFTDEGDYLMSDICDHLPVQVTSDIGGIGVYVSYWVQTGIALLGFVATLLWNSWIYYIYHGALSLRHGLKKAHEKAQWIRNGNQKHLSRLAMALTDFQKAQCFFMLAVNIAALFVLHRGGLQPSSLQQVYNTFVFIKVLAISGYLPVSFTLFTLHMIGMVSWYLLALSISSVALSVATLVSIGNFDPTQANLNDLASAYAGGGPESCGFAQLGVYCYVPITYNDNVNNKSVDAASLALSAYRILAFCLVVLLLLIFEKARVAQLPTVQRFMRWLARILGPCQHTLAYLGKTIRTVFAHPIVERGSHWLLDVGTTFLNAMTRTFSRISRKLADQAALSKPLGRKIASWRGSDRYLMAKNTSRRFSQQSWATTKHIYYTTDYTRVFQRCFVASLYIVFSVLYIYWFSIFAHLLGWFASNAVYSKDWNFGQIVAITVWAPPLCEYIHLELRGMRRGFEHRLLPPYRVTKEKDPSSEDKLEPEDPSPLMYDAADPARCEYGQVDNPESPEYLRRYSGDDKKGVCDYRESVELTGSARRYSEDETEWQLPLTVMPNGDLSPFSNP